MIKRYISALHQGYMVFGRARKRRMKFFLFHRPGFAKFISQRKVATLTPTFAPTSAIRL